MATTNHTREDDGLVQHRPANGAVLVNALPEADDFDAVLPQPGQHLGQRLAQPVKAATFTRSIGWRRPQEIQPGPVPGSLAASVLEDLLAGGQHPAGISKLLASAPIRGRSCIVFRSSFSGPRFWHGDLILRLPEFWLCSYWSPYDRVGRAEGPELRAM